VVPARATGDQPEKEFLIERIESAERFVENGAGRCVQYRRGKLHLLLIALGQRSHFVFGARQQLHPIQPMFGRPLRRAVFESPKRAEVREDRDQRHVLIESAILRQIAKRRGREPTVRHRAPRDMTFVRSRNAREHAQQGRLAGAVGSK
jgi:hypothetical protein